MRRSAFMTTLLLFLLAAVSAGADLTVTSISPAAGPTAGGRVLHIRGTGFKQACVICSPPLGGTEVAFGDEFVFANVISDTLLEVLTPPHAAGFVSITLAHDVGKAESVTLPNAFLYTDDALPGQDPFLFPIFAPPIDGAFGSRFVTTVLVKNASAEPSTMPLYGHDIRCLLFTTGPDVPLLFRNEDEERSLTPDCSLWTGRLFYVPETHSRDFVASIRVADDTRQELGHGVDIPVVSVKEDFKRDRITLIGVPSDPRFRKALRIYSMGEGGFVNVRIDNGQTRRVALTPGHDIYEPTVGIFTDFPGPESLTGDTSSFRVTIENPRDDDGSIPENAPLIWAFISVTNNDTQAITTVTPQP